MVNNLPCLLYNPLNFSFKPEASNTPVVIAFYKLLSILNFEWRFQVDF